MTSQEKDIVIALHSVLNGLRIDYTIGDAEIMVALEIAIQEIGKLRQALGFASSVIKSGEPWTETCENEIGALLRRAGK